MRVLDVGSGSGDVSLLAADLVGSHGHVVGVDRSPAAVERARTRAFRRNLRNVSFEVGDPASMHFDRPFDAIIGRFVLMYQDDPVTSLRNIMRYLREGGVVAFQELDSTRSLCSRKRHVGWCRDCAAAERGPNLGYRCIHYSLTAACRNQGCARTP